MFQKAVLFIALRYICRKKTNQFSQYIYWVASVAIGLGIAILIVVLSVMNGFESNLKKNSLCFFPHVLLTADQGYVHIGNIPNLTLDKLHNIEYMQPLILSDIILQSATRTSTGFMLGIDPNYLKAVSIFSKNNSIHQLVSGKYYIIIGSRLAHHLDVHINDQVRLIVPSVSQMTLIGYVPSQRLCTILDIYPTHQNIDIHQVLVHQLDAVKLMRYPSEQYITGWRLWLRDPFLINDFYKSSLSKDWICKDWREYQGSIFQAMQIEKNIMSLLLSLIIIAACFNIMSFLVLLVMEKKTEIAILQTYGLTRIQIMFIFMIQGISSGIFGIIYGVSLGVLFSKNLNQILFYLNIFPEILLFPVEIKIYQILIVVCITFIIVMLITLYPAWYASSVPPAKILRYRS